MIIGLTGQMGCGKGEIVKILGKLGFKHITFSSIVKEEAKRRGISEERENLMEVGNSMRLQEGAGVLTSRILKKIQGSGHENWVVDGIRNPAEINELRKGGGVYIIGVHADQDLLVERILKRQRVEDSAKRDEIVRKIEREWGKGEPDGGQQVGKCMKMADFVIKNEGTLEELEKEFIDFYNSVR